MNAQSPVISIIVPVHQGGAGLRTSLAAIAASDLPREMWELIVVDDASTDDTVLIAAEYADCLVRLPTRHGPAYARNRGVEMSRGSLLAFFDPRVCPHPDALRRMVEVLEAQPDVSAVFGAYDTKPAARGFVSQYRNLLHHYVHHRSAGEAETFWAGCGAIRRDAFMAAGMYDEWKYTRAQIEDVELGHRVRALGNRILLVPAIQCSSMRRWRLRDVLRGDFKDRGVPWTRLLMQMRAMGRTTTLNLATVEKLNTVLVWVVVALLGAAAVTRSAIAGWTTAGVLLFVLASSAPFYSFLRRERGIAFTLGALPLHLLYYLNNGLAVAYGWLAHHTVGEPTPNALTQAFAEVGMQVWPPVRRGRTAHR